MTKPVLPLLDYVINQDYIAEVLCINKDKADLKCAGKCYLMQQLKEQEKNKPHHTPKVSLEEYPLGFVFIAKIDSNKGTTLKPKTYSQYNKPYNYLFSSTNIKPPAIVS